MNQTIHAAQIKSVARDAGLHWLQQPHARQRCSRHVLVGMLILLVSLPGCSALRVKPLAIFGSKECPNCRSQQSAACGHQCCANHACCAAPGESTGMPHSPMPQSAMTQWPATPFPVTTHPGLNSQALNPPGLNVPQVPGVPLNAAIDTPLQPVPGVSEVDDASARETEQQLQDCRRATDELTLQIQELKQQLASNQRTTTAMSSALQFLNREMQKVSTDMEYWKAESQRQDAASRRQIAAERETLAEIQRMLQSAAGSDAAATRTLPPVEGNSAL